MATMFDLENGAKFVASERHVPAVPPFGSFGDGKGAEDRLKAWAAEKWAMLFELKRGETERLRTNELFYIGRHYDDAFVNRIHPVTNYCHSTVETIWPILTESMPRPEPVPRRWMDAEGIRRVRDWATFKMDTCGFDRVIRVCTRDLLKYGWCCPMIGWDAKGTALPRYLSPFDYYPDSATEESELECFAIARAVPTRRLRALFPARAHLIQPDNIVSPSYDVMVRPYLEEAGALPRLQVIPISGVMQSIAIEGDPASTTGYYSMDTGSFQVFGQTSFLIQLFVRDYTTMKVLYRGDKFIPHERYGMLQIPFSQHRSEPCCPSGWRMLPILANGTILAPPLPVDPAIGGLPVEIGRNYETGGRFYSKGELDDVIPIQRDINRSDEMIARALELQANPPVKLTSNSRVMTDRSSVEGGELLRLAPGATMEYLQPASLAESHFERRAGRRQDIQIVAGTPDSLQGQRPIGVEAAQAIRQLTESGASRARAKGPAMLEWAARLLQKTMRCDAKKAREPIYYRGSDGRDMWLDPAHMVPEDWDVRWAQDSGDAQSERDRRDLDLQLLQLGVIDAQQVLEDLDYPDRGNILMRVGMQQMQMAAAAQKGGGGKNGGPPR